MKSWQLQQAKAHFSQVVKEAISRFYGGIAKRLCECGPTSKFQRSV